MTDSGTGSSSKLLQESLSFAGPLATGPHTPQGALSSSSAMLSVDFSTPLGGAARMERIKQMTQNHASCPLKTEYRILNGMLTRGPQLAFENSRHTQAILVKAQHALRRMPGVSSPEANELVSQLKAVGQMINQETSQLVDALMNVTLDQEETDKAIARMSIDANLAQAMTDDQAQTISDLRAEVKTEREKRARLEAEAKQALQRIEALGEELDRVRHHVVEERHESTPPDDLVQVGESACRQGSPQAIRRAQSLADNLRQMDRRIVSAAPAWLRDQRQEKQVVQQKTAGGQFHTMTRNLHML
ncbi:hypothetical protein OCS_02635 [Ophiocordyceps sinensis CO18]|uniref:Uncharacterized protein n=1 Tax=Ophiocordyceps sinensis (strain Co18 / CGMCC 3.14243) TaxID=911162 RepID=T5AIL3_OPHSC|nr:hypothetical protein OCS_02635 [Ophiocordyceps sinensis CO18]